jgi:hypothetical protein
MQEPLVNYACGLTSLEVMQPRSKGVQVGCMMGACSVDYYSSVRRWLYTVYRRHIMHAAL